MKKFLKTIAIMLAVVMVAEVPVSAANVSFAGVGSAAVVAAEDGQDAQAADKGTNDGTDDGADKGTTDADDKGTGDGADGTGDGADIDLSKQVIAVAFKGAKSYNVEAGETLAVAVNVITNNEFDYDVNWSVKGSAVTVKGEGKNAVITAVQGGKATVTASAGNKSDSIVVNVKEYITAMNFAQDEYTCYQKHKINFADELVKTPVNGNDEITYSVDNKKIATVDAKGVVTMKKVGTVVLTAATERGVFAQTTIKVEEGNPATKISVKQGKKLTLKDTDETAELEVVVDKTKKGGETTDTFVWSSSKPAIVAVDDNGDGTATITAVGVGSSKLTVKAASGKKATITVTANAVLKSIDIVDVNGADSADTYPKKKLTLSVEKDPAVSKDKITWSIDKSQKKLASVNNKGVVTIKAKSVTEATDVTVTASTKSGIKDAFVVTINPSEITALGKVEGANTLWVGEEALYTASVEGGSDEEITWTSSSKKVLSIDENGYAVGLKAGKATVKATVTLANGKTKTESFKVTVKQPATELSMKKAVVTTNEGKKKTVTFNAVQGPKGAKESVSYEIISDDTKAATIKGKKVTVPASAKAGDVIVVQATAGSLTCEGTILVVKGKNKVTLTNSNIKKNKITVNQGEVFNLEAKMLYDVNEELTYSVAKSGVVSVDANGNVYALHPGTAKVTAKSTSGAKATVTVKVVAASVESDGSGDANDSTGTGDANDGTTDGK